MNLQKFTTFEYGCKAKIYTDNGLKEEDVTIEHKINESDKSQSFICIKSDSAKMKINIELLNEIYKVMQEVDPFSFAFAETEND